MDIKNTDVKATLLKKRAIKFNSTVHKLFQSMSLLEKFFVALFIFGLIFTVGNMSKNAYISLSEEVPAQGGEIREGIVGTPRFINPLLATSEVDKSFTEIVYAGLYTYDKSGNLIPELAANTEIDGDGTIYRVTLKEGLTFHDGTPVTARDIVFTVKAVQDPFVRSALRPNWNGVQVEALSERTVEFTLPNAFKPFLHNLTLGILPSHLWEREPLEQMAFNEINLHPVGAGPYKVTGINKDEHRNGRTFRYTLRAFDKYTLGMPYITRLEIDTWTDEGSLFDAFEEGRIDASPSIRAERFEGGEYNTENLLSRKVFAVFLNSNTQGLFRELDIRRALGASIDKDHLVEQSLNGLGESIESPMPFMGEKPEASTDSPEEAWSSAGWQINEETGNMEGQDGETLSFTLHTSDAKELQSTANILKSAWSDMGINVEVETRGISDLLENVIRPRAYEALLFGYVIGYDNDLYGFWHSGGRNDPGLNTALYTNLRVDELLESARETEDIDELSDVFTEINSIIKNDQPAIFLYSPVIAYATHKDIGGDKMETLVNASDRFITVHTWYLHTKRVWSTFNN